MESWKPSLSWTNIDQFSVRVDDNGITNPNIMPLDFLDAPQWNIMYDVTTL
jgi:hypothetical protein